MKEFKGVRAPTENNMTASWGVVDEVRCDLVWRGVAWCGLVLCDLMHV